MINKEKVGSEKQFSELENPPNLLDDLVANFLKEEVSILEEDKERLLEKLKITANLIEKKQTALGQAIKEKESSEALKILSLELEQKKMVLEELEKHLSALQIAIEKKRNI